MMNVRDARFALRLLTIACAAAVPAVIAAGLLTPRATAVAERSVERARPSPTTGPAAAPSPDEFGVVLDRALRPPLGDVASSPTSAASDPAPAADVVTLTKRLTLVGTVGESVALIRGPDGTVALVEVGDDVEGADVIAIRQQQVDLRQGGRLVRLQKASPPAESPDIIVR